MNNIGLIYSTQDIIDLLTPVHEPNAGGDLVGLIFARGQMDGEHEIVKIPCNFSVRRVYFNPSNENNKISFYSTEPIPLASTGFLRENESRKLSNPSTQSKEIDPTKDRIQYIPGSDWKYSFFSLAELQILTRVSPYIVISGSQMDTGSLAKPIEDFASPFPTIIAEAYKPAVVDEAVEDEKEEPFPTFIIGLPCPPYWELGSGNIIKMVDVLYVKTQKCCLNKQLIKANFSKDLRKAWSSFNQELQVKIPSKEKNTIGPGDTDTKKGIVKKKEGALDKNGEVTKKS